MVGKQTALIAAHAEMVDQESACGGGVGRWVEGGCTRVGLVRREKTRDVLVELVNLTDEGPDEVCMVRGEMWKGLMAFGVLDLIVCVSWNVACGSQCLAYQFVPKIAVHAVRVCDGEVRKSIAGESNESV